ncbi:putative reverse transcriptase domain-containing protein [Tanacetum coccineum]
MNGWLIEDEDEPLEHEASDTEVDSDLESTASSKPKLKKSAKAILDLTNNVNNANGRNGGNHGNGGNGGNNGCTYKGFMACNPKECDGKGGAIALTRWIEKMENVIDNSGCTENQKVKYVASSFVNKKLCPSNEIEKLESEFWNHKMVGANHAGYTNWFHELAKLVKHLVTPESSRIKRAGILTDEVVSFRTLTKGYKKRKGVEESSKQGGGRNDDKRAKVSKGFVASTSHRNEYTGPHPKCAKCWTYHPEGRPCIVCFNCQKLGHYARNCCMPIKQVAPINAVRGGYEPETCYECRSPEHYQNTCPKLNLAPGQAFNVDAVGALQDPNVVMGTFSLNNHYATILFDYGADFSFISTHFAPLLNVKPSFVNPRYVIEVADGHGSFDVIVEMDWLSEHKAEIVCHEKVVRILLESGEILCVQGECTPGIAKALSNVKALGQSQTFLGVLYSGIVLNHASFSDHGMLPPLSKLKGLCELSASSCNGKIIGARSVNIVAMALNVNMKVELPLDDFGHGPHTTSTVAGVFEKNAQAFGGAAAGTNVEMAPLSIMKMSNTIIEIKV